MTVNQMTIRIGGAAGDGVESTGAGFCQALTRGGLYVFGLADYYSRIRGGHNFYSVRISDRSLCSHEEPVHLLLALTEETLPRHRDQIVQGGAVVYDTALKVSPEDLIGEGITYIGVALSGIAQEQAGTTLARNTVALGVAAGMTGFELDSLQSVIRDNFARKGQAVVDGNLGAVEAGYNEGIKHAAGYAFKLQGDANAPRRMALNGTDAFAMGALAGGCRFVCGYPMTPGSLALHWMVAHAQDYGVVIKHTEDEIAAINMAIGAAHMGARALVPTSGGGFSLMVEGLGLAGMTETPVVIYNAQRPGPATGLPTRNEQADLLFMLHASQGEFPRIMLAPGTHEQAFVAGWRAFNLAERYQTPVLVLSDHYLAVAVRTVDPEAFDFDAVHIDRGALLSEADLDAMQEPYRRFKITESGISPRAIPGHPKAVYTAASNEHNERGTISEEPDVRTSQVDKRMRKLVAATAEMAAPAWYGPSGAEITCVCWGTTIGPLCEAVDRFNAAGGSANVLHFQDLWPLPADAVNEALDRAGRLIAVEVNATAQLATLIRAQTGRSMDGTLLRYDGRPFTPEYILERLGR
jgi:2-oxoglutarate/2-oxoacid ferredoxin oxidoreductase subunit alpha